MKQSINEFDIVFISYDEPNADDAMMFPTSVIVETTKLSIL